MYKLQTIHYNSRYNHYRNNQINVCTKNNVLLRSKATHTRVCCS